MGRLVRLALASICLLTSVACGWVETVDPTAGQGGTPPVNTTPPPSTPPPSTPPPALAAYTVRWYPSASSGVTGYELTIEHAPSNSTRVVDIPLTEAAQFGSQLRYAINLETDRDHVLSLRAYDGSSMSPPSNQIVVRSSALIASATAAMDAGPSAAMADSTFTAEPAGTQALASDDVATGTAATTAEATAGSGAGEDAEAGEAAPPAASIAALALDGSGDHLVGRFGETEAEVLGGQSDATLAMWLRPLLDDAPRRVVFSLADGSEGGFDRLELAVVEGGSLELVMRDEAGRVGYRALFPAALVHDVWQHVALVVDGGADAPVGLHVDGVPVSGDGAASGAPTAVAAAGVLRIGAGSQGEGFAGHVGHVALWSRALGDDELATASVRGHSLDLRADEFATALVHYWRLGEGDAGFEFDHADTSAPIDLAPSSANVAWVEDAPLPLD